MEVQAPKVLIVGDSRTVGMAVNDGVPYGRYHTLYNTTRKNVAYIAQEGEGYSFLNQNEAAIDKRISECSDIVISLGVNDIANSEKYVEYIQKMAPIWRQQGKNVYFSSVAPVDQSLARSKGYSTCPSNSQINDFNQKLKQACENVGVQWIDVNQFCVQNSLKTSDGLHYNSGDNNGKIRNYIISQIQGYVNQHGYPDIAENQQSSSATQQVSMADQSQLKNENLSIGGVAAAQVQTTYNTGNQDVDLVLQETSTYLSYFLEKKGKIDGNTGDENHSGQHYYSAQQLVDFYKVADESTKKLVEQFCVAQAEMIRNTARGQDIMLACDSLGNIITKGGTVMADENDNLAGLEDIVVAGHNGFIIQYMKTLGISYSQEDVSNLTTKVRAQYETWRKSGNPNDQMKATTLALYIGRQKSQNEYVGDQVEYHANAAGSARSATTLDGVNAGGQKQGVASVEAGDLEAEGYLDPLDALRGLIDDANGNEAAAPDVQAPDVTDENYFSTLLEAALGIVGENADHGKDDFIKNFLGKVARLDFTPNETQIAQLTTLSEKQQTQDEGLLQQAIRDRGSDTHGATPQSLGATPSALENSSNNRTETQSIMTNDSHNARDLWGYVANCTPTYFYSFLRDAPQIADEHKPAGWMNSKQLKEWLSGQQFSEAERKAIDAFVEAQYATIRNPNDWAAIRRETGRLETSQYNVAQSVIKTLKEQAPNNSNSDSNGDSSGVRNSNSDSNANANTDDNTRGNEDVSSAEASPSNDSPANEGESSPGEKNEGVSYPHLPQNLIEAVNNKPEEMYKYFMKHSKDCGGFKTASVLDENGKPDSKKMLAFLEDNYPYFTESRKHKIDVACRKRDPEHYVYPPFEDEVSRKMLVARMIKKYKVEGLDADADVTAVAAAYRRLSGSQRSELRSEAEEYACQDHDIKICQYGHASGGTEYDQENTDRAGKKPPVQQGENQQTSSTEQTSKKKKTFLGISFGRRCIGGNDR